MTILTVAQGVAAHIGMDVPDALMASTDREHVELREVIQDTAQQIAFDSGTEWQDLLSVHSFTGDGSTENFDFPSNFKRLGQSNEIWTSRLIAPLTQVENANAWREIEVRDYGYVSGVWIRIGGSMQIKPAPAATETISYYYLTDTPWRLASSGANASAPEADGDTFRLPERLLKLGAIWNWKQLKGLDYAEDMAQFQIALQRATMDDKPARPIRQGGRRIAGDARIAYPLRVD